MWRFWSCESDKSCNCKLFLQLNKMESKQHKIVQQFKKRFCAVNKERKYLNKLERTITLRFGKVNVFSDPIIICRKLALQVKIS